MNTRVYSRGLTEGTYR